MKRILSSCLLGVLLVSSVLAGKASAEEGWRYGRDQQDYRLERLRDRRERDWRDYRRQEWRERRRQEWRERRRQEWRERRRQEWRDRRRPERFDYYYEYRNRY